LIDEQKGFVFIETDSGGDVFVDQSAILATGLKNLTFGQRVSFDIVREGEAKGSESENVRALEAYLQDKERHCGI
jgi:CspA family cold shock protein